MTWLRADQLVVAIPGQTPCSEHALTIDFKPGEVWGVLGPNGVGKTTLLHTLASLTTPAMGQVMLDDTPLKDLHRTHIAQQVGVMFQAHQDGFPATVFETALLGRFPHLSPWDMESEQDLALAEQALAQLDLTSLVQRSLSTLSGGERQRAALATLLTQQPEIWLVDEPTNHLDLHHQVAVMALLKEQALRQKTVIMSLHDVNLAAQWCSHVLLLYPDRAPIWGRAETLLTQEYLEPLYRQSLAVTEVNQRPVFVPVAQVYKSID
ncbi:ABC transporter ATP-binding protein [Marinomonas ostreistagni]|uniref:ABC transporter ATP-binding protein n=1 Tax=Marinomonas ostreistagni TaxID=359209 RepID=UPI00194F1546|nr:ABC transporter ATP-binding protein [Marinomonas ostreistagni]MBM6549819.1 ABC transporter ATP-binding protein [Marinomonas ostreistagni]